MYFAVIELPYKNSTARDVIASLLILQHIGIIQQCFISDDFP